MSFEADDVHITGRVAIKTSDNRDLITYTGFVLLNFHGPSSGTEFARDVLQFPIKDTRPPPKDSGCTAICGTISTASRRWSAAWHRSLMTTKQSMQAGPSMRSYRNSSDNHSKCGSIAL